MYHMIGVVCGCTSIFFICQIKEVTLTLTLREGCDVSTTLSHFMRLWPQYTTVTLATDDQKYDLIMMKNVANKILKTPNHHFVEGKMEQLWFIILQNRIIIIHDIIHQIFIKSNPIFNYYFSAIVIECGCILLLPLYEMLSL